MTAEPTAEPAEIVGAGPDFPVEFAEPWHAGLTWEWDDMHMPFALAPLAGDYVRALGQGFNEWKTLWGDFPSRTYGAVFNGYAYFAFSQNSTDEERLANRERALQVWRERAEVTEAYWHDEVLPELQSIYASMRAVPVEAAAGPELAIAWEAAWEQAERAWRLHFNVILGPYQILEDLADLYESVTPGASPGEALQLIQGARHELFRMECGIEALTALADGAPDVAAALRAGTRSADELATIEGGRAFVDAFDAFLEEHGHMGQSADDLALASWGDDPGLLLAEVAKRLDSPPAELAEVRRERLAREADRLVEEARRRFVAADRAAEIPKFERILELSRRIGPITEVHNYWIDRAAQGNLRSLALRVGQRLANEGVIGQREDVLFLHRAEVGSLLAEPADRRAVIAERRERHERQRRNPPPRYVGKAPEPEETGPVDRFDSPKEQAVEEGTLRGTGASAGIVRGPARVVLTSNEFDRVRPGDIIVCPSSNPSWVPVFTIAAGLVTNTGGVLSHAAVVAREFGLPAVTGTRTATSTIRDGQLIEIDGTQGTVRLL